MRHTSKNVKEEVGYHLKPQVRTKKKSENWASDSNTVKDKKGRNYRETKIEQLEG